MAHARAEILRLSAGSRWADFGVRLVSAAILAPIALVALWQGGPAWEVLVGATVFGLGVEWSGLAGLRPGDWLAWLLPVALLAVLAVAIRSSILEACVIMGLLTLLLAARPGWFAALGVPYVGIAGLALLWLRLESAHGLQAALFLVAVVWSTDIGAYLVGRVIGGAKLAPRISPGKTWSGAAGGLVFGALAGAILAANFGGHAGRAMLAALALSLAAQAGDLLESAIKRRIGVKDSGWTIPGHGGLFDRLDGFLAAAPLAAVLAYAAQQGGLPIWR